MGEPRIANNIVHALMWGWDKVNNRWLGVKTDTDGNLNVALAAGTNNIGDVDVASIAEGETHIGEVAGKITRISVTIAGHAGVGGYAIGDVVGTLTEVPLLARALGKQGYITEIRLEANKKSITPRFRVHFYNASNPTVAADDANHKELYADAAKRMGYLDLPAMTTAPDAAGSDMSRSILGLGNAGMPKPLVFAAATRSVWVLLEALDAFTPADTQGHTLVVVMENY